MIDNREKVKKEILDEITFPVHGIFLLSPRVGKTALAIDIIKKQKCGSVLWVTPSVKLRDIDIPEEFVKWKAKSYLKNTDIICYSSLINHTGKYDLVILDEIQHITDNNSLCLFNKKVEYNTIVGLTGTMPKHDEKLQLISRLKLNIIKEITIDEAVKQELVADYKIKVLEVSMESTKKTVEAGSKKKPFKTTESSNYEYLSKNVNKAMFLRNDKLIQFSIMKRLRAIYNSPTKLETAQKLIKSLDGRKLIFSGSIEHAEKLSPYYYHSKTNQDHLNMFLEGKVDILSCVNAGGTGFTYKNVNHFIIVQADSNKSGGTTQKLARSLLKQQDYSAVIWVICLMGTQDEKWVESALSSFDQNKIEYINIKNLKL